MLCGPYQPAQQAARLLVSGQVAAGHVAPDVNTLMDAGSALVSKGGKHKCGLVCIAIWSACSLGPAIASAMQVIAYTVVFELNEQAVFGTVADLWPLCCATHVAGICGGVERGAVTCAYALHRLRQRQVPRSMRGRHYRRLRHSSPAVPCPRARQRPSDILQVGAGLLACPKEDYGSKGKGAAGLLGCIYHQRAVSSGHGRHALVHVQR